jgi:serine/threonine protein kinase
MTPERWQMVRGILQSAMELRPEERVAYLDRECASDPSLRKDVNEYLSIEGKLDPEFLEKPAAEQVALPSTTTAGNPILTAGTRLGPYEIQALIGAGGMGEVYRARDTRLNRTVAIKVIPRAHASDTFRKQRFEREARAISALQHPNICTLYDVGHQDGTHYLVMEYLEGETLAKRLSKGRLTLDLTLRYGVEVADALDTAHHRGIVHRDLKPGNIFITTHGETKVLDFGLAKLDEADSEVDTSAETATSEKLVTTPGVAMGTAPYMSPEQARGEELDARTDIFSLGAVLYEMATGKMAFPGKTTAMVNKAILDATPPAPSQIVPSLPADLDHIVAKALEKDRNVRHQSAADLRADLVRLRRDTGSGKVVATSSDLKVGRDTRQKGQKASLRRNWILTGVASLLLLGLAAGWLLSRRNPARKSELTQRQLIAFTAENPLVVGILSQDGRYLAYSLPEGIWIQEIDTGQTHKVPGTSGLTPRRWYPDVRLLVTDRTQDLWDLFIASGEKHKLTSNVSDASICGNGEKLVFQRGLVELWVMPAAGGEPRKALSLANGESIADFAWSPDCNAIVYIWMSESKGTLETTNLNNRKSRVLLKDERLSGGRGNAVSWLPDGRILFGLYTRNEFETDLWALSLDTSGSPHGDPVRITNSPGMSIVALSASANGARLAASWSRDNTAIFIGSLSHSGGKLDRPYHLTGNSWNEWPDAWAPDGKSLLFDSMRQKRGIYRSRIASGAPELVVGGATNYSGAAFSRDGDWIMAFAGEKLIRTHASGGSQEEITEVALPASVHCAVSGTRACILSEEIGKQTVFSLIDPIRGRMGEVSKVNAVNLNWHWNLSPDGSKIAMVENMSDDVKILDLRSRQIQVIHPKPRQEGLQYVDWSVDGKACYLSGEGRLLRMDADGNTQLLLPIFNTWVGGLMTSPDGEHLAYTRMVEESNITLLENF